MDTDPRLTTQTLGILALLLAEPDRPQYGLELSAAAEIKSGVIYPALARLERAGWLQSAWEEIDPSAAGRPRRRLYRLTATGRGKATRALAEHAARLRFTPRWSSEPSAA